MSSALEMKKRPSPGIWKIVSTTNDPVSNAAAAGPRYDTTGCTALRRMCTKYTRPRDAPFAKAVRT